MITSTVPVYVSECSNATSRGTSVAKQLSIVIVSSRIWYGENRSNMCQFGTVVAYWIDYGTIKHLTGEVILIELGDGIHADIL